MPAIVIFIGLANAGQNAAFTPMLVSNAVFGFDAADASSVTLNVADVASITDKSGGAHTAAQVTAGQQPLYDLAAVNGLNAIAFTGANNDQLDLASSLGIARNKTGFSFAGVIKIPTLGVLQQIFTIPSSLSNGVLFAPQISIGGLLRLNTRRVAADTISTLSSSAAVTAGQAAFVAGTVTYSTGAVVLYIDATTRSQTAAWATGAASEDVAHSASVSLGRLSSNILTGSICEMWGYDRTLTAQEVSDLRTRYFKPKWATP